MPAVTLSQTTEADLPDVREFNRAVRDHGVVFVLPESPTSEWLPAKPGNRQFMEHWLLREGEELIGGYRLRHQPFWVRGKPLEVINCQGPVTAASYDSRRMMDGVKLLRTLQRQHQHIYLYGMGGLERELPRLLASANWPITLVPFFFRVLRGGAFLRNIVPLRSSALRRCCFDLAAACGVGQLCFTALHGMRRQHKPEAGVRAVQVEEFGEWADRIWEVARGQIVFTAERSAELQNIVFPPGGSGNVRLRVLRGNEDIGWAVVRSTPFKEHRQFGAMRVASIIDNLALPGLEAEVVRVAGEYLQGTGADIIVSNQCHRSWQSALLANGYLSGPSNCCLALSPLLAKSLGLSKEHKADAAIADWHFTRADGDGPINL